MCCENITEEMLEQISSVCKEVITKCLPDLVRPIIEQLTPKLQNMIELSKNEVMAEIVWLYRVKKKILQISRR